MRTGICAFIGAIGGFIATMFGGWSTGLTSLLIFMAIDYVSGIVVAGVFHKSKKTDTGTLQSVAGWKGLCKKGMTLLFVLIAHRLDVALAINYVRDAVIIGFMANELLSIVENAGLMGIKLPAIITTAIDVLNKKSQDNTDVEGSVK